MFQRIKGITLYALYKFTTYLLTYLLHLIFQTTITEQVMEEEFWRPFYTATNNETSNKTEFSSRPRQRSIRATMTLLTGRVRSLTTIIQSGRDIQY